MAHRHQRVTIARVSNEEHHPHEIATPSPSLMVERGKIAGGGSPHAATPLDIPRYGGPHLRYPNRSQSRVRETGT